MTMYIAAPGRSRVATAVSIVPLATTLAPPPARGSSRAYADYLFGTDLERDPNSRKWVMRYLVLSIVIALVMISRKHDSIFNAQFWAEDGQIYFSEQLTLGFWSALGKLWLGFPYLVIRLVAACGGVVSLAVVPLLYNASAIAISALAMATFSLPGFRHLVSSDALRAAFCLAVVSSPAVEEVLATPTNLSWWLGLWLVLVSVMRAPRSPTLVIGWCLGGVLAIFTAPAAPLAAPLWALRVVYGARGRRNRDLAFSHTTRGPPGTGGHHRLAGSAMAAIISAIPSLVGA
jgi:hypothetical protein